MTAAPHLLGLVRTVGPVPLPNVPPVPQVDTVPGLLPLVAFAVTVVATVLFATLGVRFITARPDRLPTWRPLIITAAVLLVSCALGIVSITMERASERETRDAIRHDRIEAAQNAVAALEEAYGVTYPTSPLVPVTEGDHFQQLLTLPDGSTSSCFTVADAGFYAIRCGGTSPESSTPLVMVGEP